MVAFDPAAKASQKVRDLSTRASAQGNPHIYTAPLVSFDRYTYHPLNTPTHIRIFVLESGLNQQMISCSLEEVDINDQPAYEALSYCWGDSADEFKIPCAGQTLTVRKNLYDALQTLRHVEMARRLWVDAICINQRNSAERAQQVQLMGLIYEQCRLCIVWLGPHTSQDALAFRFLSNVEILRNKYHGRKTPKNSMSPGNHPFRRYSITPGQWSAISLLFERPWFQRIWTLQESVLPSNIMIACGNFQYDGRKCLDAVISIRDNEAELLLRSTEGGYLQSLKIAAARRDYHEHGRRQSLLSVLRDARERVASDPRDKIYGVLGLCRHEDQTAIVPSYRKPIHEVYESVARYILASDLRPLDLLLAICGPFDRDRENLSPLWVPNWNYQIALPDALREFEENSACFKAGGTKQPSIRFCPGRFGQEEMILRGKLVDQLGDPYDSIGSAEFNEQYKKDNYKSRSEKLKDWAADCTVGFAFRLIIWIFDGHEDKPEVCPEQLWIRHCYASTTKHRKELNTGELWQVLTREANARRKREMLPFVRDFRMYIEFDHQHDVKNQAQTALFHDLYTWCRHRNLCPSLSSQRFGWVPRDARKGDLVCVFEGVDFPYILREVAKDDRGNMSFAFVGYCYFSDIMRGEAIDNSSLDVKDITLL